MVHICQWRVRWKPDDLGHAMPREALQETSWCNTHWHPSIIAHTLTNHVTLQTKLSYRMTPDKSEKSVTMVPVTPEKSVLYTVPVWHLRNLYALFFYFVHQPHYKEPLIMNMEYYTTLYLPSTVTIDKFNEHDSSRYAEILPQQWKAVAWVSRPIPIPVIEWVGPRTRAF